MRNPSLAGHRSRILCGLAPALLCAAAGCGTSKPATEVEVAPDAGADASKDVAEEEEAAEAAANHGGGLGAACLGDTDCGEGGTICRRADEDTYFGGGPAGGYCTLSCDDYAYGLTAIDPCEALGGVCFGDAASGGWCAERCKRGAADSGGKCHGRLDSVACMQIYDVHGAPGPDACVPLCTALTTCGRGRACNLRTRKCVDKEYVPEGDPVGTGATGPNDERCAGPVVSLYLPGADQTMFRCYQCSRLCVLGGPADQCGPMQACYWAPSSNATGDWGMCAQLCDEVADCRDEYNPVKCDNRALLEWNHGVCLPTAAGGG